MLELAELWQGDSGAVRKLRHAEAALLQAQISLEVRTVEPTRSECLAAIGTEVFRMPMWALVASG